MTDAGPTGNVFEQIRSATKGAGAPSDPSDPEHRARTFAAVRREAETLGLFVGVPRYDRPLRADVIDTVKAAVSVPLFLVLAAFCLRLGDPFSWLGGVPLAAIAVLCAVYGCVAVRRIFAVRRGPLRTEVVHLRIDSVLARGLADRIADAWSDRTACWFETEAGRTVHALVADGLYLELPLDGWGVAHLKGRVLVDFAQVRVPHVTEGRLGPV